jgi:parallel beta-helix repeat protein
MGAGVLNNMYTLTKNRFINNHRASYRFYLGYEPMRQNTFLFADTDFVNSTSYAANVQMFLHRGSSLRDSFTVLRCRFLGYKNTGGGSKFNAFSHGGAISFDSSALLNQGMKIEIKSTQFEANQAFSFGGAVAFSFRSSNYGVSLANISAGGVLQSIQISISDSDFLANSASGVNNQGGALSLLFPDDAPSNLQFKHCEHDVCTSQTRLVEGTYRQWRRSNSITIRNSVFSGNFVAGDGGLGGGLAVQNGVLVMENCSVSNNRASLYGAGVYLAGSTSLVLRDSTLKGNRCLRSGHRHRSNEGLCRGSQLYFSAGGDINITGNSRILLPTIAQKNAEEGLTATQAGAVHWSTSARALCAAGGELSPTSGSLSHNSTELVPPWVLSQHNSVDNKGRVIKNGSNCPCFWTSNGEVGETVASDVVPSMLVTTLSLMCQACPAHSYSFEYGGLFGGNKSGIRCRDCEYGANCDLGADTIRPTKNFWGLVDNASRRVQLFRCPDGFCCGELVCNGSLSQCHEGHNRTGILCGECVPGYTQTLGSALCRPTELCDDAPWFIPVWLLLSLAYTAYTVTLGASVRSTRWPFAMVYPLLYYFQLSRLLIIDPSALWPALHTLLAALDFQLAVVSRDTSSGAATSFAPCPFSSLSPLGNLLWGYATPFAVLFWLLLIGAWHRVLPMSATAHWKQAIGSLLLMAFTSCLTTTFQLLRCVDIQGKSRMFYAAEIECTGSVTFPLVLALVVQSLPIALSLLLAFLITLGRCKQDVGTATAPTALVRETALEAQSKVATSQPTNWAWRNGVRNVERSLRSGLACCCIDIDRVNELTMLLRLPFTPDCWYWTAVQAAQRLFMAAVYALSDKLQSPALLQLIASVLALTLHILCQPFVDDRMNHAVTILSLFLVLVAALCVPESIAALIHSPSSGEQGSPYVSLQAKTSAGIFALLIVPLAASTVFFARHLFLKWVRWLDCSSTLHEATTGDDLHSPLLRSASKGAIIRRRAERQEEEEDSFGSNDGGVAAHEAARLEAQKSRPVSHSSDDMASWHSCGSSTWSDYSSTKPSDGTDAGRGGRGGLTQ